MYAVLHGPDGADRANVAVLILPTFGWDNDCSYRARRDWATALAQAGAFAARIDFPGTGDSAGSPLASNRIEAWIDATTAAAAWLRQVSDCERLVVAGIGLGGFIAVRAAVAGAPVDDLILWAVRASGRAHMREMRAYAAIVAGEVGEDPEAYGDGVVSIGGHRIDADTMKALSKLSLVDQPVPHAHLRRVLLVARDAGGVDPALESHLRGCGAHVSTMNFDEHRLLMEPPEFGFTPTRTINASTAWVFDLATPASSHIEYASSHGVLSAHDSVEFMSGDVILRETLVEVESPVGRLVGVITKPVASTGPSSPCLILANAGSLRRTGPNRMTVEIARQAAADGVTSVRFDFPGLGDSDGKLIRSFERRPSDDAISLVAINAICDELHRQGISDRFIAGGHCFGGSIAIRAVAVDDRVIGAIGINVAGFVRTDAERRRQLRGAKQRAGAMLRQGDVEPSQHEHLLPSWTRRFGDTWARLVLATWKHVNQFDLLWRIVYNDQFGSSIKAIDELGASDAHIVLMLSGDERLIRLAGQRKIASRLRRWPNITIERLPGNDHLLRSLKVQDAALARFGAALHDMASAPVETTDPRFTP